MKFSIKTIVLPLLTAASTKAWELTISATDGRSISARGVFGSGCVTYDTNFPNLVNKVEFRDSAFGKTIELYENEGCVGEVSFKSGAGTHILTPIRTIRSYKVYL